MSPVQEDVILQPRLKLHDSVLNAYDRQARAAGCSLDEFLGRKLTECSIYTASRPVYINDAQRRKLEAILGHNLSNADQIIQEIVKWNRVKIGDISLKVGPVVIERLRSRCPRREPFDAWLQHKLTELLEQEVGMR